MKERGVTFLELLIAIVILVVVIIGILQLFDQDVEVRKQQDQMAEMQQNLRAAMDLIARDVRGASACASVPARFVTPLGDILFRAPLPIAVAWMPNVGTCPSGQQPCRSQQALTPPDTTRPDGLGVMRCISNGIVDVVGDPNPIGNVTLTQGLGLQPSDVGKFLIFWSSTPDDAATDKPVVPYYFTARIASFAVIPTDQVLGEVITLGPPIQPTNDAYATFGTHWYNASDVTISGKIMNFNPSSFPVGQKWKAAVVEWVEYIVDKWDNNDIPHAYSAATREGSLEHPLLARRVNPYMDNGKLVPEWDVIAHDIEDMQVVWLWDPDGNPETDTRIPGLNLEYQAGDPSRYAEPPAVPGYLNTGVGRISDLAPGRRLWKRPFDQVNCLQPTSECATPAALRKIRVTLLARTREKDMKFGDAKTTGAPSRGFGFPSIEDNPLYLQGSASITGGVPTPPLYLSGYRRRALTSELAIRNYVPGGLK